MDRYSRLVAFLKVLLPLTALGLLSTLFLLSRSVDPSSTIPFGEAEITERLREGRITGPHYSGTTPGGDQITVTATSAKPGSLGSLAEADGLRAQIDFSGGGSLRLSAQTGTFDPENDIARFSGDLLIETATGYTLTTDALETRIKGLGARSDGPVEGDSPLGHLQAGQMELTSNNDTNNAHLLFKNGVKLVYDPKDTKDAP